MASGAGRKVLAMYEFTTRLATLEPPPAEMQQLLGAICGNQLAMDDFVSVNAGTLSPDVFFSPEHMNRHSRLPRFRISGGAVDPQSVAGPERPSLSGIERGKKVG